MLSYILNVVFQYHQMVVFQWQMVVSQKDLRQKQQVLKQGLIALILYFLDFFWAKDLAVESPWAKVFSILSVEHEKDVLRNV